MSILSKLNARHRTNSAPDKEEVDASIVLDRFGIDVEAVFPMAELGYGLSAQLMVITPEMCREWLGSMGRVQRNPKKHHLAAMERDLSLGDWRLTGEPFIFDDKGFMVDGQHRALAIINTGIPVLAVVIRGIPPDAYEAIDICAKRSGGDALNASGIPNSSLVAAAARLVYCYENSLWRSPFALSPLQTKAIVERHSPLLIEAARSGMRARPVISSTAAATFCYYLFVRLAPQDAIVFWDSLVEGANLQKGSPILAFRNRIKDRATATELSAMLIKAWNAYRQKRTLQSLKWGNGDPFPIAI